MPLKIGVFDSGLGGLTVYKALKTVLPADKFIYLADSKRCPYGIKSADSIIEICKNNVEFFDSLNVDKIVIACHTASTIAYETLKTSSAAEIIPIHIVSGNFLLNLPLKSSLLILGTQSTIKNGYYQNLLKTFRPDLLIQATACPFLVEYIQHQIQDPKMIDEILSSYGLGTLSFDYIFLACTHFPIAADFIQQKAGPKTVLIDPSFLLANFLKPIGFSKNQIFTEDIFYVHGQTDEFNQFASIYLKKTISSSSILLEKSVKI